MVGRLRERVVGDRAGPDNSLAIFLSSAALIAGKVATMGFGFPAWIVAARMYPTNEVGLASGAVAAVTLCAQVALIGVGSAVITLLPVFGPRPVRLRSRNAPANSTPMKRGDKESVIVAYGPTASRSGQPVRWLNPAIAEPCPPKPG